MCVLQLVALQMQSLPFKELSYYLSDPSTEANLAGKYIFVWRCLKSTLYFEMKSCIYGIRNGGWDNNFNLKRAWNIKKCKVKFEMIIFKFCKLTSSKDNLLLMHVLSCWDWNNNFKTKTAGNFTKCKHSCRLNIENNFHVLQFDIVQG